MAHKKDSMIKMVCVLTATCLIAGVALSFTYTKTKSAIMNAEHASTLASIERVLPPFEGQPEEKTIVVDGEERTYYIAKRNGAIIGVATRSSAVGYGGTLSILVGVDPSGGITGMVLLQHQETPGLGSKAGTTEFLGQFSGKRLAVPEDVFSVTKDGGDITAITAATISSRAVAQAATKALQSFMQDKKDIL